MNLRRELSTLVLVGVASSPCSWAYDWEVGVGVESTQDEWQPIGEFYSVGLVKYLSEFEYAAGVPYAESTFVNRDSFAVANFRRGEGYFSIYGPKPGPSSQKREDKTYELGLTLGKQESKHLFSFMFQKNEFKEEEKFYEPIRYNIPLKDSYRHPDYEGEVKYVPEDWQGTPYEPWVLLRAEYRDERTFFDLEEFDDNGDGVVDRVTNEGTENLPNGEYEVGRANLGNKNQYFDADRFSVGYEYYLADLWTVGIDAHYKKSEHFNVNQFTSKTWNLFTVKSVVMDLHSHYLLPLGDERWLSFDMGIQYTDMSNVWEFNRDAVRYDIENGIIVNSEELIYNESMKNSFHDWYYDFGVSFFFNRKSELYVDYSYMGFGGLSDEYELGGVYYFSDRMNLQVSAKRTKSTVNRYDPNEDFYRMRIAYKY